MKVFSDRGEFSNEYLDSEDEEMDLHGYQGITYKTETESGSLKFLVGIFDGSIGTVVHECTHIAIHIATHTGWEITVSSSEPFCYLLDNLVELTSPILKT